MRMGGEGGFTPSLGKINKKFLCKSFVLDINFKKDSVQMRMG